MKLQDIKEIAIMVIMGILIGLYTYYLLHKPKEFKRVELYTPNQVFNLGTQRDLDTILVAGLNALEIKGIQIAIRYVTERDKVIAKAPKLAGFTYAEGNKYLVSIIPTTREHSIRIIAHELQHVKQLYDKRVMVNETQLIWLGEDFSNKIPPYKDRPWEIEAYHKEDSIISLMKKKLY